MAIIGTDDFEDWDGFVRQLHRMWSMDSMASLSVPQRSVRGVIVDADAESRQGLQVVLSRAGYKVMTCRSFAAAAHIVHKFEFNFLVVDYGLEDGDGIDLLHQFVNEKRVLKVMTGYEYQIEEASRYRRLHCDVVIAKPYHSLAASRVISKALKRLQYR